jgi:TM2 domain-containing membrane protein YozV
MNCAQHPETPAIAYCRMCGKALCENCKRDVQGTIFCDPCLAARVHGAGSFGAAAPPYGAPEGYESPVRPPESASPGLAFFLGMIPGVGAFYNGQFLKGFVHVIVLATLIWLSDHGMGDFAGLLIAAWFFYMIFDAFTTAKARRDGRPIPDPLGLNHILEGRDGTFRERVEQAGERVGARMETVASEVGQRWKQAGGAAPGTTEANFTAAGATGSGTTANGGTSREEVKGAVRDAAKAAAGVAEAAANLAAERIRSQSGAYYKGPQDTVYPGPQGTYYAGPEGTYYEPPKHRERGPAGAVVLIGLGIVFLLANLGWFSMHWLSSLWPVILIAIGVWIFVQRQQRGKR